MSQLSVLLALVFSTAEPTSWSSGPLLAPLLLETDAVPGLQIEGYDPTRAVASSDCRVDVLRPARGDGALRAATNRLACRFSYAEGDGGTIEASLADSDVLYWGNQFDRHKPFELQGAVADGLFEILLDAYRSGTAGDLIDRHAVCGPDGRVCIEIVSMMRFSADESPAAMVCSKENEDGRSNGIECVFHPQR